MKFFSFLLAITCSITLSSQTIVGPIDPCLGDCVTYEIQSSSDGPFIWNVNGASTDGSVANTVVICWEENDMQVISATDVTATPGNHLTQLSVTVHDAANTGIIFPRYPDCEIVRDSIDGSTGEQEIPPITCKTTCGGTTVTYDTPYHLGSSYTWSVTGAQSVITNDNEVTVTWPIPAGSGYIAVEEISSFGCFSTDEYCIEVLEVPEATIAASQSTICQGQSISLSSDTEAIAYYWSSGDGQFAQGNTTTFDYTVGGNYNIQLVTETACHCYDTTYYPIQVLTTPGPEILCVGTTCISDTTTYYAADICSQYDWVTSANGTVIEGGSGSDDYITVVWNAGPTGTIQLTTNGCSGNICNTPSVETIPILGGISTIEGPQTICKGSRTSYSVTAYDGVSYIWTIPSQGIIAEGQYTNQIVVEWPDEFGEPYSGTISVTYDNCILECGGSATLPVQVLNPYTTSISGDACPGEDAYLYAQHIWDGVQVDWTITDPMGSTVHTDLNTSSTVYDFSAGPGLYTIYTIADDSQYCNADQEYKVEVKEKIAPVTDITGPLLVCLGETATYSILINQDLYTILWRITDGSNTWIYNENHLEYTWNTSGPYLVEARIREANTSCYSDWYAIEPKFANSGVIYGDDVVCVDTKVIYDLGDPARTDLNWSVTPAQAGSIRVLPDGSVEVHWHEDGTHTLMSGYCSQGYSLTVDVIGASALNITAPTGVCAGELAAVSFAAQAGTTYEVRDDQDNVVGSSSSIMLPAGTYKVEITDANGCMSIETFDIVEYGDPNIRISTPDDTGFCPPESGPTLYALNTLSGYTYEWFMDGVSLGVMTESYQANVLGTYYVIATSPDGCDIKSNEILLFEYCGNNPRCNGQCSGFPSCADGTLVSFTSDNVGYCNEYSFTNTSSDYVSGTIMYHFGDPEAGADSISVLENPTHTFTNAGYYLVTMIAQVTANVNPPFCWDYQDIVVPVAADFRAFDACVGEEMPFEQLCTFIPGYMVSSYEWDFGDPASGVDNTSKQSDPTHTYSTSGSYQVTLTVTSNTGCQSRITKTIEVLGDPNIDFNIPVVQCQDQAISFDAIVGNDIIEVEWDFGDPSSGAANMSNRLNALHTFSASQVYTVTLIGRDIYGCETSISKPIDISNSILSGDINLSPATVCRGDSVILTAPSGGVSYLWSNGQTGNPIKIADDKLYYVTIIDAGGCQYSPDAAELDFYHDTEFDIDGYTYISTFLTEFQEKEIALCEGERFDLRVNYANNVTYLWSVNGYTDTYFPYFNGLNTLPAGTHDISVEVTFTNTGCVYEVDPFQITIYPRPDAPLVVSDVADPCEGVDRILSITNYDSQNKYFWSTGEEGASIQVNKSDYYEVSALSPDGCESWTSGYWVRPLPDANVFTDGCLQVCFPDTLCLPTHGGYTYDWYHNGILTVSNSSDYIIDLPGDYQVDITSPNGCSVMSDILSIDARPSDHSLEGIVFLDNDGNGGYNAGDDLLENAVVRLLNGNTVIATVLTDANGTYSFDNIGVIDPTIEVDISSLGLNVPSPIQSADISFDDCRDEKEEDFPFTTECIVQTMDLYLNTCPGEPLTYETLTLAPGDSGTLSYTNIGGCDSLVIVHAVEIPPYVYTYDVIHSCDGTDGSIDLSANDPSLSFSIDNIVDLAPTTVITDISAGTHTLWVSDIYGCLQSATIDILQPSDPDLSLTSSTTCIYDTDGLLSINVNDGQSYDYSIDGVTWSDNTTIDQLATGSYTLYIANEDGCVWDIPFAVDSYAEPMINLTTTPSCDGSSNGALSIDILDGSTLSFTIDNGPSSLSTQYTDLGPGMYDLTILDANGCSYPYAFVIDEQAGPEVSISTVVSCPSGDNGSITINAVDAGSYTYSMDGLNFQIGDSFTDLAVGTYDVYIQTAAGCVDIQSVTVASAPDPTVIISTTDACPDLANGSALVSSMDSGLMYSLDGINYSSDPQISDLPAGLYDMYVLDVQGCEHIYPFEISEAPELIVEFIDPAIDCSMDQAVLEPQIISSASGLDITWSTGLDADALSVTEDGNYEVYITDACMQSSYSYEVSFIEGSIGTFHAPNIFSPNNDGSNDEFLPVYADPSQITSYEMTIFDRWGNLVFETQDLNEGWKGLHHANEGRAGVYVWIIRAIGNFCEQDEVIELVGDVTVIR